LVEICRKNFRAHISMTMQLIVCVQLLPEDVKVFDGKIHIRLQTIVNKDRNWKRRLGDKPNVADLMVF